MTINERLQALADASPIEGIRIDDCRVYMPDCYGFFEEEDWALEWNEDASLYRAYLYDTSAERYLESPAYHHQDELEEAFRRVEADYLSRHSIKEQIRNAVAKTSLGPCVIEDSWHEGDVTLTLEGDDEFCLKYYQPNINGSDKAKWTTGEPRKPSLDHATLEDAIAHLVAVRATAATAPEAQYEYEILLPDDAFDTQTTAADLQIGDQFQLIGFPDTYVVTGPDVTLPCRSLISSGPVRILNRDVRPPESTKVLLKDVPKFTPFRWFGATYAWVEGQHGDRESCIMDSGRRCHFDSADIRDLPVTLIPGASVKITPVL